MLVYPNNAHRFFYQVDFRDLVRAKLEFDFTIINLFSNKMVPADELRSLLPDLILVLPSAALALDYSLHSLQELTVDRELRNRSHNAFIANNLIRHCFCGYTFMAVFCWKLYANEPLLISFFLSLNFAAIGCFLKLRLITALVFCNGKL